MDTIRIAERLSEGWVFIDRRVGETGPQPRCGGQSGEAHRDHARRPPKDELATKRDLDVLEARLRAEFQSGLASVRNQLLTAQVAAFFGVILYITFRL